MRVPAVLPVQGSAIATPLPAAIAQGAATKPSAPLMGDGEGPAAAQGIPVPGAPAPPAGQSLSLQRVDGTRELALRCCGGCCALLVQVLCQPQGERIACVEPRAAPPHSRPLLQQCVAELVLGS